jgi:hypothetical protein
MPYIQNTKGSGEATFHTDGGLLKCLIQARKIREICESTGLKKIPFRRVLRDLEIEVSYSYHHECYGVDPHIPAWADSQPTIWTGLYVFVTSKKTAIERAEKLKDKLDQYTKSTY